MIVHLRVFGALERYLGGSRFEIELPSGTTVRELLELVHQRWGDALPPQFWDAEAKRFQGPVLMMTRNADIKDVDVRLSDQQEIWLLVPLAGGQGISTRLVEKGIRQ